ncbi:MAG: hypothetical protein HON53_23765 [Planctomycetaceae bacterium]|nr:hypothetical protein [Planctomycetaceae bacterium]MBT6157078.1 hypothetical protein [Planctomycetaceae bacterium]MBT6484356.1 hypothetical protein [Planctomycetaceae bacterium]MBT6498089.1 hypothetical protein [Planctomycetaceae bacterium]
MRPIVTVIAQLAMILAAAQAQAAPESPAPIHTSKTQFRIPYRYDAGEMRKLDAQEIRLFVSMDRGTNWQHVQTVAPATGRFDFVAKGDGEYWFSVRTVDGGGRLFPRGELNRAGLKVIVDATPPRFEVKVRQQKPGRVQLSWRSDDTNIDTRTLRLEYLQEGRQRWQPVSVMPQASGQTSWSIPQGGRVSVRGSITDMADNIARAEQQTQIAPTAPVRRPPREPSYDEPIAQLPGTDFMSEGSGEPDGRLPLIANGRPFADIPSQSAAELNSQFASNRDEVPLPPLPPVEEQFSMTEVEKQAPIEKQTPATDFEKQTPAAEAESEIFLDAAGNRIVRDGSFDISYEIGEVGPSGIGAVEFYITRDAGRKWFKLGDDLDHRSPFRVKVPGDGIYGFEIRVRSGAGLAADPPQPGDDPSIIVVVDQTPPVVQLYPAQQGQGASLNKIMIRWKAEDENPASRSVSLAYSTTPNGPWTTIRDWDKDTGSYLWVVAGNVGPQLFVAVSARDAAGNVRRVVTSKPILVDLKKPSAKIVGVKSSAKGSRR